MYYLLAAWLSGEATVEDVIAPGEVHEYHSFSVLATFEGTMEGTYLMQREDGSRFQAQIPRFGQQPAAFA